LTQVKSPSLNYSSNLQIGAELPENGITYYDVPTEYGVKEYRYTVVNGRTVLSIRARDALFKSSTEYRISNDESLAQAGLFSVAGQPAAAAVNWPMSALGRFCCESRLLPMDR
jgi:Protein of unknown function (DUF1236)